MAGFKFNLARSSSLLLPLLLALQAQGGVIRQGHHQLEKRSPYNPAADPMSPAYVAPTPTPTPTYTAPAPLPTPTTYTAPATYPGQGMRKKRSPSPLNLLGTNGNSGLLTVLLGGGSQVESASVQSEPQSPQVNRFDVVDIEENSAQNQQLTPEQFAMLVAMSQPQPAQAQSAKQTKAVIKAPNQKQSQTSSTELSASDLKLLQALMNSQSQSQSVGVTNLNVGKLHTAAHH